MAVVNKFNVNREQVTLDADIIENMSANDVSYNDSFQYDENTVGDKLSKLESQVIYDVTANNNGATFASLSELLSNENLSTLIPVSVRYGGMSIRFVQSSDSNYVQFRYIGTITEGIHNPFLNTANWQGLDDSPTVSSHNLVESGGVYNFVAPVIVRNTLFDGTITFNAGIKYYNMLLSPAIKTGSKLRIITNGLELSYIRLFKDITGIQTITNNLDDFIVEVSDNINMIQFGIPTSYEESKTCNVQVISPINYSDYAANLQSQIEKGDEKINDIQSNFVHSTFLDGTITFNAGTKYANLSLSSTLNTGDVIQIITEEVTLSQIALFSGYTTVQTYNDFLNNIIININNDRINLIQFRIRYVFQKNTSFRVKIYKNVSVDDKDNNLTYKIDVLKNEIEKIQNSAKSNINWKMCEDINQMLSQRFPIHSMKLVQRMTQKYDFQNITITEDYTTPQIGGAVDIKVSSNPLVHKGDVSNIAIFQTGDNICVGTKDCYDLYYIDAISDLTLSCTLVKNGMDRIDKTISATLNVTMGGTTHTFHPQVFNYMDILAYEYNQMPTTLSTDNLHPNNTGFTYLNEIVADEIKNHFGGANRIISFGDSWTAMSKGWKEAGSILSAHVDNQGVGSQWIEHIMDRFTAYMGTYTPQDGDVFVFLMGTNNFYQKYYAGDITAPNYETRQAAIPYSQNAVTAYKDACEIISEALPKGNWLVSGGNYISLPNDFI